jgi:hypothetical protein
MKSLFKSKVLSAFLVAFIGLSFSLGYAATVQPQADTVYFTTTGSTLTSANFPYGTRVTGIKITPGTAAARYRLRVGTAISGAILYETMSGSTTAPLTLDKAQFRIPNTGMYFESSEAGADLKCFIYTDVQ